MKRRATPIAGRCKPDTTANPRLDAALTVAEAIRHNRLRRLADGVSDARLIGSPTSDPPAP
jgi:hypothetical protein